MCFFVEMIWCYDVVVGGIELEYDGGYGGYVVGGVVSCFGVF